MSNKHKLVAEKSLQRDVELAIPPHGILQKIKVKAALELADRAGRAGRFSNAITIYQKVIDVVPKFPLPYFLQAKLQLQTGNRQCARDLIARALEISVGNADYYLHAGNLLGDLHENELSFSLIERAFRLAPESPEVLTFYAAALVKRGDVEQAIKWLKKVIVIAPQYVGAYLMLSATDPEQIDDAMLEKINRLLEKIERSDSQAQLLFAAAGAYAKRGDFAAEFHCLDRGNAIIRQWTSWTWQADYQCWKQIAEKITGDFVEKISSVGCRKITPIILATLPRSGTTLLEQIISTHADVCAAGESNLFHGPLMEVSQRLFSTPHYWSSLNESNAEFFLENYTARIGELLIEQKLDKHYITDKSLGNFSSVGIMLAAFPHAKAIHCKRNALDVCLSCYQHYFDKLFYTSNLEDMARMCNLFDHAMDYWKMIFPDRIMTVCYEDLVENPQRVARDIFNFLGLEWQADCLDFYKNNAVVHTASRQQVRQPINKNGLARWKKYEYYLEPAIKTLSKNLETE